MSAIIANHSNAQRAAAAASIVARAGRRWGLLPYQVVIAASIAANVVPAARPERGRCCMSTKVEFNLPSFCAHLGLRRCPDADRGLRQGPTENEGPLPTAQQAIYFCLCCDGACGLRDIVILIPTKTGGLVCDRHDSGWNQVDPRTDQHSKCPPSSIRSFKPNGGRLSSVVDNEFLERRAHLSALQVGGSRKVPRVQRFHADKQYAETHA